MTTASHLLRSAASVAALVVIALLARDAAGDDREGRQSQAAGGAPLHVISLAEAVSIARTRGFDVLLSAAAVRGAEADVRTAGAPPNPFLSGGPSRRVDCRDCASPWGAFASLSDQGLVEGAITRKRALRADVARRALDAARFGRADVDRIIVAQTKVQYVQTAAAQTTLDFARQVAASLEKSVEVNRVRYPRVIDEGQLARFEQEAMKAQQEVDRAVRELRQQQIELAVLLGMQGTIPELGVDRTVLAFRVPDALVPTDMSALLRTAIESRPDRKQAASRIAQSEAEITFAERQRIPDVSLLVQFQQLGAGTDAPQPPTLSIGLGLALPLLYQQQGEIARAEADRQTALVMRTRLEAAVVAELESAVNAFATARTIVERYESALLERAKRAKDITQIQFDAGSAKLTDLLDAQRSWVQVNVEYYAELVNYWTAVFLLEQAVGKELVRR